MDDSPTAKIRNRFERVVISIDEAIARRQPEVNKELGSNPVKVHLVVVTKSQPVEIVRAAIDAGATILGENYAEEAVEKIAALPDCQVEWHMIGHVQSRKAGLVAKNFSMLHSMDNIKLAGKLNRACEESDRTLAVLVEINVSGEENKFGIPAWDEDNWHYLLPIFEQFMAFPRLTLHGLMTMPPFFEDPELVRPYFQRLRRLREYLQGHFPKVDLSDLSMGTSSDYLIAVEEGATYVRVGQAILGPRPV